MGEERRDATDESETRLRRALFGYSVKSLLSLFSPSVLSPPENLTKEKKKCKKVERPILPPKPNPSPLFPSSLFLFFPPTTTTTHSLFFPLKLLRSALPYDLWIATLPAPFRLNGGKGREGLSIREEPGIGSLCQLVGASLEVIDSSEQLFPASLQHKHLPSHHSEGGMREKGARNGRSRDQLRPFVFFFFHSLFPLSSSNFFPRSFSFARRTALPLAAL